MSFSCPRKYLPHCTKKAIFIVQRLRFPQKGNCRGGLGQFLHGIDVKLRPCVAFGNDVGALKNTLKVIEYKIKK